MGLESIFSDNLSTFTFLSGAAVLKYAVCYYLGRQQVKAAKLVGNVSRINLYPMKSVPGFELQETECTNNGL